FIPVTLAVIVGVLAADAIRHAIGTVFGGDDAPSQVEAGPREAPAAREQATPGSVSEAEPRADAAAGVDAGAAPGLAQREEQDTPAADEPARAGGVLELPDSMTARRDGDPAACLNGTVANRVEGGWEQALEGDAPVPCVVVNR